MPNIGIILKNEITRLSRRSTRPIYSSLKKDVVALKHSVAQLKRENQRLLRDNAVLMGELKKRIAVLPSVTDEEARRSRMSPKLIKAQRMRLGLSQQDFGKLLGASVGSVLAWETGRARPREKVRASLAAVRKLQKREARRRLEAIASANGSVNKKAAKSAGKSRKVPRKYVKKP